MVNEIKKEGNGEASVSFESTYSAFTAHLKQCEDGHYKIFGVKTSKCPIFNWGFSGGKEDVQDGGKIINTSKREHIEETTTDNPNPVEPYFKIVRTNNLDKGFEVKREFVNYFLLSFMTVEPTERPHLSPKESIIGMGWFTFHEFERLMLKQNHRIAFVELCYLLDEHAREKGDSILQEDVSQCVYKLFERPSSVGNVLMYKYEDDKGTSDWSRKSLFYLINPSLFEGFKIFANPKDTAK